MVWNAVDCRPVRGAAHSGDVVIADVAISDDGLVGDLQTAAGPHQRVDRLILLPTPRATRSEAGTSDRGQDLGTCGRKPSAAQKVPVSRLPDPGSRAPPGERTDGEVSS
jgi:hypothetical protein